MPKKNQQSVEVGAEIVRETIMRGGQAHPGIAFLRIYFSPTVLGDSMAVPGSKPNAIGPPPAPRDSFSASSGSPSSLPEDKKVE